MPTVDPMLSAAQKRNTSAREESIKLLKSDGIEVTDKLVTTSKGQFPQIALTKESKYAKFSTVNHKDGLPKGWTEATASEAQRFGMNFMLQDLVDSPISGTGKVSKKEREAWKARAVEKLHPKWKDEILELNVLNEFVFDPEWAKGTEFMAANYSYPFDALTPRIRSVEIEKVGSQQFENTVYYQFEGTITMNASTADNPQVAEKTTWMLGYGVGKVDGEYKISGFRDRWEPSDETLAPPSKAKN